MVLTRKSGVFIAIVLVVIAASTARAQNSVPTPPDPSLYQWEKVVGGLDSPVYLTHAGDGSGRLFILEQGGPIFIVKNGILNPSPFLDLTDLVIDDVIKGGYTERGLLGLAFHPNYAKNGLFFVYYINPAGDSVLARYKVMANNPDQADPASAVILLTVKQPYENHKGGQLADNLKIPPSNPFVGNSAFLPEIWAYGLRNPWRFSFDRANGDLYIGEVGEATWEEIDFQPASSKGGENYGWNYYEGFELFAKKPIPPGLTFVPPIAVYGHTEGCAVMGGYVYRGKALPNLAGIYFYADYCSGRMWTTYRAADGKWQTAVFMNTQHIISSFGEDEQGELYFLDYKGEVYRLAAK